jgi:nucleotide-binding universal stress UspA family protein
MTISYQRILVPLDGSEFAALALPHAETIAALSGARLTLIQVVPDAATMAIESTLPSTGIGMPTVDPYLATTQFEAVEEELTQNAKTVLAETAALLLAKSLQVETVIIKGTPADSIIAYATENNVDLIVMSTHGRSGLGRLVYGSVAERVLHHSPCPILLVRVVAK